MYLTPNIPPNIRGGLKTDSKCSNTTPPEADSTFESVLALLLSVISYY